MEHQRADACQPMPCSDLPHHKFVYSLAQLQRLRSWPKNLMQTWLSTMPPQYVLQWLGQFNESHAGKSNKVLKQQLSGALNQVIQQHKTHMAHTHCSGALSKMSLDCFQLAGHSHASPGPKAKRRSAEGSDRTGKRQKRATVGP